ncbi:hypothetical protein BpHYR1_048446 [Brachionus plicatilis]|uniref:Uncharacterized protein n=1 Tax=Brachionus plicatilis TaxID=10195 RepID=A0A3M7RML2_BRAPC|nr:hypothetical protein BpHYR1_048446 [Brachionus plicatilis]
MVMLGIVEISNNFYEIKNHDDRVIYKTSFQKGKICGRRNLSVNIRGKFIQSNTNEDNEEYDYKIDKY